MDDEKLLKKIPEFHIHIFSKYNGYIGYCVQFRTYADIEIK